MWAEIEAIQFELPPHRGEIDHTIGKAILEIKPFAQYRGTTSDGFLLGENGFAKF